MVVLPPEAVLLREHGLCLGLKVGNQIITCAADLLGQRVANFKGIESVCEQVAALLLSPLTLPYQRPVTFVCFRLPHARSPRERGASQFFLLFFVQIAAVISVYSANTHTSIHRVVSLLMDLFD